MAGLTVDSQQPNTPSTSPKPAWNNFNPDVRAALLVSPAIIIFELLSSLLPVLGYLITFPLAIATYLIQGFLVGRWAKTEPGQAPLKPLLYLRLGAISGIWTSVFVSNAVTLITLVVVTPASLGAYLLALPAVLAASLLDILINVGVSALGAWLYAQLGGKWAVTLSCLLGFIGLALSCALVAVAAALAAGLLSGKIHL
jgi:hypothetical protein